MSPRVVRLTERVPRTVPLRRADVDFLLAHHRGRFEVVPTGAAGRYRLTARGVAGMLATPNARLAIRPKLPAANLWRLIDSRHPPPAGWVGSDPVDAERVVDALAGHFAALLGRQVAAGLHRDYAERAEVSTCLRGRLDLAEQARDHSGRRDRLHCRFDDFSADIACNRLPRAIAEALTDHADLDPAVRSVLRSLLPGFDGVAGGPLTRELCAAAAPDGHSAAGYGPLLDLCRLIAAGLAPGIAAGPVAGPTFLLDLEAVWERYVTAAVADGSGRRRQSVLRVQPFLRVGSPEPGRPDLHLRPDVLVEQCGKPAAVVDAKWKRLARTGLPTDDIYQVLAYAAALGAPRAVLVYPGGRNRRWVYPTAGPTLEVWSLRVTGSLRACQACRQWFARALVRPT